MQKKLLNLIAANTIRKLATTAVICACSLTLFAQGNISGKVTDEAGEPLPGASISVKGSTQGVMSDVDGGFKINAPSDATLVVSYIGYVKQEVQVGSKTFLEIVLKEDAQALDEVIVVGYGTRVKGALTGSIGKTDSKIFETRPIANATNALQGAIPGLMVIRGSGRPGNTQVEMQVRGYSSMAGAKPLVLIDGVSGDMNMLNPNDIEDVTVLKDAAASIYGARASDGVILVTTKKGKAGKLQLSYSGNYGVKTPSYLKKMSPTNEMVDLYNEGRVNVGLSPVTQDVYDKIKARSSEVNPNGGWLQGYESYPGFYGDFDHNEDVLGNGTVQGHNMTVSGGSENSVHLLSFGFSRDEGFFKVNNSVADKYYVGLNSNFNNMFGNRLDVETRFRFDSRNWREPTETDNVFNQLPKLWRFIPERNPAGNYYMWEGFGHPNVMLEEAGNRYHTDGKVTINAKANLKLAEGLKLTGQYGIWLYAAEDQTEHPTWLTYDWDNNIRRTSNSPNSAENNSSYNRYSSYTAYLEYNKTFAKHNINLMAGASHEENDDRSRNIWGQGLLSNDIFTINLSDKTDIKNLRANTYASDWALTSWFGRIGYNYDMKYLLDLTLRADGSSKFASGKRWSALFPAVQAAWNLGNESFVSSMNVFDNLKLRLSWGQSGNQQLSFGNYDYIPLVALNNSAYLFGTPGVNATGATSSLASSERSWETITTYNAGLDFAVFQSRLSGSMDVYRKKNSDMLVRQDLPALLGGSAPTQNIGELETTGFELTLGWKDKLNDDFRYGITFMLSDSKNKLIRLKGNDTKAEGLVTAREGYSLYSYFGYKSNGIIQTEEQLAEYKKMGGTVPARLGLGDMMYQDIDGDGKITAFGDDGKSGDLAYLGNMLPRYTYSSNIDLSWKNWDFSLFLQGVGKRNVIRTGDFRSPFERRWFQPMAYFYGKTWTADRPDAEFPKVLFGDVGWDDVRNWDYRFSDAPHRLINTAYLRAKLITLAYRLPQQICQKLTLQSVRVYVTGEDLFTISPGTWGGSFDPEEGWQRQDADTYPFSKIVTMGIDIKF